MAWDFKKQGDWKVPGSSEVQRLFKLIRNEVVHYLRDYTRVRVRDFSEGAGGSPLEGYSDSPVTIDYPGDIKKKRKPVGGTKTHDGMFFFGGYKQYRRNVGLESGRFQFFNTGDAWRDWKVLRYGDGAITENHIGFSDDANAIAASSAQVKRPLLFSVDKTELSVVDGRVVDLINSTFFPA